MNWITLTNEAQLEELVNRSYSAPQVIFKHSTRCSISNVAKNRLEKAQTPGDIDFYYLDLLNYRPVSNAIAETFAVDHESPQLLLIKDGKCVYNESHMGIDMEELKDQLN